MSDGIDCVTNALVTLDAWRERSCDRIDPMRFRIIEALTRRTSQHEGDARRVLDARLSSLIDAYARDVERTKLHDETRCVDATPSPLAALLDDLAKHANTHQQPAELLDYLRAVWSTVSAEKRLRESLAQVPKKRRSAQFEQPRASRRCR